MKLSLMVFILILSLSAQARIEVAFLEAWTGSGKKVELEKQGRFAHVAIRYKNKWLHSAPRNGTELVDRFQVFAKNMITEILVDENQSDLTEIEVLSVLGMPYDFKFDWTDNNGTYCSKLIAKFLNVPPTPMKFDGSYWNGIKNLPVGAPGVSPDGLYRELLSRGYISTSFPRF